MVIQDAQKIKEEIITFLSLNGPSLPVQISRAVKVDTLFVSAFLSELLSDQKLRITFQKVGSSPVYYLPGTEEGLEKYSQYLKSKEKEAYDKLKEIKFLEDEKEHPAIRIALRQIRDYAKAFENNGKIIWRHYLIPEKDYVSSQTPREIPEKKTEEKKEIIEIKKEINKPIQKEKHPIKKEIEVKIVSQKEKQIFSNPLAKKEEPNKIKEKPKSDFVKETINFIEKKDWIIVQEIDCKPKEYNCLVRINTELGPITFRTQAKDKKTISDLDLTKLLSDSQSIPLPGLMLSTGEIQKKANEILEKYSSILKFKKIE